MNMSLFQLTWYLPIHPLELLLSYKGTCPCGRVVSTLGRHVQ